MRCVTAGVALYSLLLLLHATALGAKEKEKEDVDRRPTPINEISLAHANTPMFREQFSASWRISPSSPFPPVLLIYLRQGHRRLAIFIFEPWP